METILIGLVIGVLAIFGFKIRKGKSAEALLENKKDLERFKKLDQKRRTNKALNNAEKKERKNLRARLKNELKKKGASNEEISDFLSGRYDDSSSGK